MLIYMKVKFENFISNNVKLILLLSLTIQVTLVRPQQEQQPQQHKFATVNPYRHYFTSAKCKDLLTGRELYVGDFFTRSGQCIRIQCLGTLEIWEDRCQIPKLSDNCNSLPVANEFLDYPRCCPTYECHSYTTNPNGETETRQIYDHTGNLLRESLLHVIYQKVYVESDN
uniref:SVWC domain-containing protein n=1 Tax=Glossina austeni TaxID=7395 RepID=A0A1A9VWK9_GLOAU